MKGGKCSSCSCGRKTQSAGGSGCGRKHSGGGSMHKNHMGGGKHMNHSQHGAGYSKNHMVGGKCSKNHMGGAHHKNNMSGGKCSKNHMGGGYGKLKGGFSSPFPGDNKKELDAIPTLVTHPNSSSCKSKCGGGKKTKKSKRVSKKNKSNKKRSVKIGGSSKEMACPSYRLDLKEKPIGNQAVVARIDSCRS